jgi:single-strand DNA-binding protein
MLFINKIFLTGRATADVNVKQVGKSKLATFRLVSNRLIKKQDGSKEEKATYIDCETWEKRAEYAETRVKKGSIVYVEGRIELDEWKDSKTGENRSRLKVYVENMQVDGAKTEGGSSGGRQSRKSADEDGEDQGVPQEASGADLPF